MFKDGRPNGKGEITYKNSVPIAKVGDQFELAKYIGNFSCGKREGFGSMYWADGSNFKGLWKNDLRHKGRMIMPNGCVYEGEFKDDLFSGIKCKLYLPSMIIFEGSFDNGITSNIGCMLYPNGEVYLGQHSQFERNGLGKQIFLDGGYYEGGWEQDKMQGPHCKEFNSNYNQIYVGPFESNRKQGNGTMLDLNEQEIYEGEFGGDKRNG